VTRLAAQIAAHTPPDESAWTLLALERESGDGAITIRIRAHGEAAYVELARWRDGDRIASIGLRPEELDRVVEALREARAKTLGADPKAESRRIKKIVGLE
jgi:hypothetical protein